MEEKKATEPVLEPLKTAEEVEQAIEAILFAAGHPMRYDKLAEVLSLTVKDIKAMVREIAKKYAAEDSVHGIQLLQYPTACQLATKETYAPYIREALGIRRGGNLSASTMEALAVVAYNQPVTRTFVDDVRGVDSSYAVTSLIDKGLIEAAGRLEAPGRPMLYVTTDKFLRVFGINSLDELPQTEALSVSAQVQAENAGDNGEQLEIDLNDAENLPDADEPLPADAPDYRPVDEDDDGNLIFEDGTPDAGASPEGA